jgi:hypothetical protein
LFYIIVLDTFGKPPSGIIEGNLLWLGEYSECINISQPFYNWHGKYCYISKPTDPMNPLAFAIVSFSKIN